MKSPINVHTVTSLDLPALQPYKTLRRPLEHMKEGIFVAEGEKVVRRLLDSGLSVVSMLMTQHWYDQLFLSEELKSRHREPLPVFIADKKIVEAIVGYNLHQGIMAVGRLPGEITLDKVMASIPEPSLLVALDGLVNAENVGVVVRNCAAFGVGAIIVGETSSSPYLRRAVRNSMGTVFRLPIVHTTDLCEALESLHQEYQINIIAAHPDGELSIQEMDFASGTCFVYGNEGEGISENILKVCTARIAIPMMNGTDSLNVASASAVFLYEARKQRGNPANLRA